MEFRTVIDISRGGVALQPCEEVLLVGSCFADGIGRRFLENGFPATVNPYGTMYNPASVLHTVRRQLAERPDYRPRVAFLTLGTNHVYRLRETGEIVDNCQKRPAALFQEEELSIDACADYLRQTVYLLCRRRPDVEVVLTVSPIRYRKYGYHGSQLSKATLLLAIDKVLGDECWVMDNSSTQHPSPITQHLYYFPAYEIVTDELRDYRFYAADMLHPSEQAVDYVWERMVEWGFSAEARQFLDEWRPLRQALGHRPFNADSAEYRALMDKTMLKVAALREKYPKLAVPLQP